MKIINGDDFLFGSRHRPRVGTGYSVLLQCNDDPVQIIKGKSLYEIVNRLFQLDIYRARKLLRNKKWPDISLDLLEELIEDFETILSGRHVQEVKFEDFDHDSSYSCRIYSSQHLKVILNSLKNRYVKYCLKFHRKYNYPSAVNTRICELYEDYYRELTSISTCAEITPLQDYLIKKLNDNKGCYKAILSTPQEINSLADYSGNICFILFDTKRDYYRNLKEIFQGLEIKVSTAEQSFDPLDPWAAVLHRLDILQSQLWLVESSLNLEVFISKCPRAITKSVPLVELVSPSFAIEQNRS